MRTAYAFDGSADNLRQRAVSGVAQVALSQIVRLFVQFGSVVLLSWLLPPAEFGLLAMVGPVVAFAAMFQDLGIGQAIVQKPSLTQAEVSGLFWIGLGLSASLTILVVAVSPWVGAFYGEPRASSLTAALGGLIVLGSLGSLHGAILTRRMQFGVLAVIDAVTAVAGLVTSMIVALLYRSVWALYAGSLVTTVLPIAAYWRATRWRPSLPRRGAGVGTALRFGANITGFNVANFFARNLDNILIGRVWGESALGLYDRAYKLLLFPLQQINGPISRVMLPVLSQTAGDPDRYSRAFFGALAPMLLLTLPGVAFMVGSADLLIPTLMGRQWAAASPLFVVLGIAAFVQVLNNPTGWLFISQDRTRDYMRWGLFSSTTCVGSFLIGLPYGTFGMAVAYTVGEYLRTPLLWRVVTRRGPITANAVVRTALPHYGGAVASLAAVAAAQVLLPLSPVPLLGASLAISYLCSAGVLVLVPQGRETMVQTLGLARRFLPKVLHSR